MACTPTLQNGGNFGRNLLGRVKTFLFWREGLGYGGVIFREMQNCITRICDALRDLYHLYNFAKLLQKHPWRSATFSKIAGQVSMGVFQVF